MVYSELETRTIHHLSKDFGYHLKVKFDRWWQMFKCISFHNFFHKSMSTILDILKILDILYAWFLFEIPIVFRIFILSLLLLKSCMGSNEDKSPLSKNMLREWIESFFIILRWRSKSSQETIEIHCVRGLYSNLFTRMSTLKNWWLFINWQ